MSNENVAENLNLKQEETLPGGGVKEFEDLKPKDGLWYFAHPYSTSQLTSAGREANFRLCAIRTANLIWLGYSIFSPVCHSHPIETALPFFVEEPNSERWLRWIKFDELIIKNTNFTGIILAPNWETSKGCLSEREKFQQQNKEIKLYRDIAGNDL